MRAWIRPLVACAAGFALIGTAGCGALGGDKSDAAPPPNAVASLNPCQILNQQELSAYGIHAPGNPVKDVSWVPGCMYQSDDSILGLSVYVDTKDTIEATHSHSQWAKWDDVDIAGRPGAVAVNAQSKTAHVCNAMFDAGQSRIDVQVETDKAGDSSECQKAEDVAKQIAPRVPPKQ